VQSRLLFTIPICLSLLHLAARDALADDRQTQAPEIEIVQPVDRLVIDYADFSGRLEASSRVALRARVTGHLLKAVFQEGGEVKAGEVLFEIDPRMYRAELDKAQTAVALAETRLKLADSSVKRVQSLMARGPLSQEDYDKAVAERAEAELAVRFAKAGVETVHLNLEFTRVASPINGRIGRRLVDPGNLVKADETTLAEIVSADPIYAYFGIDERTLLRLRKAQIEGKLNAGRLEVDIGLVDEDGFPRKGAVDFTNNQVDPATGTVMLRAILPNTDHLVMPGMSFRVRLPLGEPHEALFIPAAAVFREISGMPFVYVVTEKDILEERRVELGRRHEDQQAIANGLKREDRVAVGPRDRLSTGVSIRPRSTPTTPSPERRPLEDKPDHGADNSRSVPPAIMVEAQYPGAAPSLVSETVRAPIEQQLSDIGANSIVTRCFGDGLCVVEVSFPRGTDAAKAQMLVQSHLALATSLLPEATQKAGLTVRKAPAGILMIVNLYSPDRRYDELYLSNYARTNIKDRLIRLAGVAEVKTIGATETAVRIHIDPDKLEARALNAVEIKQLVEQQKAGMESDPEKLSDLIVKTGPNGQDVRLKDVAEIEVGASRRERALVDGTPVVSIVISASAGASIQQLRHAIMAELAEIRSRLPEDVRLDSSFDLSAYLTVRRKPTEPEYLLLDLDLPDGASAERIYQAQARCSEIIRRIPGVAHVLALSNSPFDSITSQAALLIQLISGEKRPALPADVLSAIRSQAKEMPDAIWRVRDLSGSSRLPMAAYPINFVLQGPSLDKLQQWSEEIRKNLRAGGKLIDVWQNRDSLPHRQADVDIDRKKSAAMGIEPSTLISTIQTYLGASRLGGFSLNGRASSVIIAVGMGKNDSLDDILRVKIRNNHGDMVPIGALAAIRMVEGPAVLEFLNGQPTIRITADTSGKMTPAEARRYCEGLVEAIRRQMRLEPAYRFSSLNDSRE